MEDITLVPERQTKGAKLVYSHWDAWNPREYLRTYFLNLGQDSYENLEFLVRELKKFKNFEKVSVLDFGAGPTIFAGIAAAPVASSIHICDYLEPNLIEINKWLKAEDDYFDWSSCIDHILKLEGLETSKHSLLERSNLLRKKTQAVFRSDASLAWPIFSAAQEKYSIVISNFCADSATSSKEVWAAYMKNIFNLVEERGTILITALRNCKFYKSGNRLFPSPNINEMDLTNILIKGGFDPKSMLIEVRKVPECANEGFTTIMCASAVKLTATERMANEIFSKVSRKMKAT